jgi:hypothetical protein
MIAHMGIVYNSLERDDQKELLNHVVSRVVIDQEGKIRLELRPPFSYLQDISRQIEGDGHVKENQECRKKKTSEEISTGFSRAIDSPTAPCGRAGGIRTHTVLILSQLPLPLGYYPGSNQLYKYNGFTEWLQ